MDNQTTIGRLFGEDMITFVIPSYQRATFAVHQLAHIYFLEFFQKDNDQENSSNYQVGR